MAFTEQLRVVRETKKAAAEHPWRAILSDIAGEVGHDGVERIATDRLFDLLDVFQPDGMPRFKRTPEAQKQLKAQMVLLGWCPVRARLVTRGFAARVRAYARLPRCVPLTMAAEGQNARPACRSHNQSMTSRELSATVTSRGKMVKGSGRGAF
jgi:hypothetical protein